MQVKRSFSFKLVNRHADEGNGQLMGKEFFYHCLPFHRCIIARDRTCMRNINRNLRMIKYIHIGEYAHFPFDWLNFSSFGSLITDKSQLLKLLIFWQCYPLNYVLSGKEWTAPKLLPHLFLSASSVNGLKAVHHMSGQRHGLLFCSHMLAGICNIHHSVENSWSFSERC